MYIAKVVIYAWTVSTGDFRSATQDCMGYRCSMISRYIISFNFTKENYLPSAIDSK